MVFGHVSVFVSSTNPKAAVDLLCSIGRSVPTKNRKRMGDNDDPWGMRVLVGIWPPLNVPRSTEVVLLKMIRQTC